LLSRFGTNGTLCLQTGGKHEKQPQKQNQYQTSSCHDISITGQKYDEKADSVSYKNHEFITRRQWLFYFPIHTKKGIAC
jgi:hypothetical protein